MWRGTTHFGSTLCMAPLQYGSSYCMAPPTVWLPLLYSSPYCMTPPIVWLPLLYGSPYCRAPLIVWLPLLYGSPYCMASPIDWLPLLYGFHTFCGSPYCMAPPIVWLPMVMLPVMCRFSVYNEISCSTWFIDASEIQYTEHLFEHWHVWPMPIPRPAQRISALYKYYNIIWL